MTIKQLCSCRPLFLFAFYFVLPIIITLYGIQQATADGVWIGATCSTPDNSGLASTFVRGRANAVAEQNCKWPESAGISAIRFGDGVVTAESRYNNLSCQPRTAPPIDVFCNASVLYTCSSLSEKRDSNGWCVPNPDYTFQNGCSVKKGNPVEVSTGRKTEFKTDWTSGGSHPLSFSRTYSSATYLEIARHKSRFGVGWRSNFDSAV